MVHLGRHLLSDPYQHIQDMCLNLLQRQTHSNISEMLAARDA